VTLSLNQIDWLAGLLACIAFIVWLVRLEGQVGFLNKQVDELVIKHNALDSQLVQKLSRLETAIARIEGYLKARTEEEK
jgi:hypothetical protein